MSRYRAVHENPQGPGDARPTAMQIVDDEGLVGKLPDKIIFITGANQGIGLETARALHATGATVYMGVRDLEKGQKAIDDILSTSSSPANKAGLHLIKMHLDSLDSVRKGAAELLSQTNNKLNILVLNAGVMGPSKTKTEDGYERTFATNHLGHFLLFHLLRPALLASATPEFNSRVVSVSSQLHRASEIRFHDLHIDEEGVYDTWTAYGQSKTANIYMANEIERRHGDQGLHALSLHPGSILTNINRDLTGEGGDRDMDALMGWLGDDRENLMRGLKNAAQGAATTVFAALAKEWEGRGGKYLSDCAEAGPVAPEATPVGPDMGHAPWVYDVEKAARLWRESCKMVNVDDEDGEQTKSRESPDVDDE